MDGKCLDRCEGTAHLSFGSIVGNPVNIEAVGCIVGNVEESNRGALWLVHGLWRIGRRREVTVHGFIGRTGTTTHHVIRHLKNKSNYN